MRTILDGCRNAALHGDCQQLAEFAEAFAKRDKQLCNYAVSKAQREVTEQAERQRPADTQARARVRYRRDETKSLGS